MLLSDPAPAGGTFVTFDYGTAGVALVSPDPAFIPAGQLAANIVVPATAAGNTTITPAAIGVNGTASTVSTSAAALAIYPSSLRLGAGQYEPNDNVQSPQYLNNPVSVTLTSTDSNTVSATSPITMPSGLYYAYFNTTGKIPGAANLTASSPNWNSATMAVTVTSPKLGLVGGTTLNTTSPPSGFTVYAEDSTSGVHYRTSALAVTLSSSDPSVITVNTPALSIPAGGNSVSSGTVSPVGGGTAWLKVTASGHTPDSTLYTVVGPKLSLSWTSSIIGAGQTDINVNVQGPNSVTAPLTVTLTNSDSSVVGLPTSVIIPTSNYYVSFNVRGKTAGTERLIATAPGYQPDTAFYTVTTPRLTLSGGTTLLNFGPAQSFAVYPADSLRSGHYATSPVIVTYTSTNPAVISVNTAADTIQAGVNYANHGTVTPTGVGTAMLIASAPGYLPDTTTYTVLTPKLGFSFTHSYVGRRQYEANASIQTPNYLTAPLAVTFTQTRPSADSLSSTSLSIPSGIYYQNFSYAGLAFGTDTIIASAPGYLPDTAIVTVTTPKLTGASLPGSALTTTPPIAATIYVSDSLGSVHYSLDTLVLSAASSNAGVLLPATSSVRVPKGAQYAQQPVSFTGAGSATVTYSDSANTGYLPVTSNTVTVTGPSLAISNGTPILGLRQNGGVSSANVQVANYVTGSPLVVSLVSSDPTVVTVPATVTIPVGTYYAFFQITAHDVIGTIQITATAAGYGAANTSVQVNQPMLGISTSTTLNTTSPRQTVNVYAYDARGPSGGVHYTNEDVAVTLASSSAGVGTIDSATVVIAAGNQYNTHAQFIPGAAGTTQISATDGRAAAYRYTTATQNVAVITPTLSLWGGALSLGIGQYQDQTVQTPDYQASALTVSFAHLNSVSTTPASVVIPQGLYYNNAVRVAGVSAGTDTVTASAPGHNPTKSAVIVAPGRVDQNSAWPSTLSLSGTDSVLVTIYPRDASSTIHYVSAATVFALTGSANVSFSSGSAPITSISVPADANQVQFWVKGTSAGTSFVSISNANYSTFTSSITVTP